MNQLLAQLRKQETKVLASLKKDRDELNAAIADIESRLGTNHKPKRKRRWTPQQRNKFLKTMAAKKKG